MKSIFTITGLLFFTSAFAQLDKNTWQTGGEIKFRWYSNASSSEGFSASAAYRELYFAPSVGYFLADRFVTGLRPGISLLRYKSGGTGERYFAGPFVRYYLLPGSKRVNLAAETSFSAGLVYYSGKKEGSLTRFSVSAGPVLFISHSAAIELQIGYKLEKEKQSQLQFDFSGLHTAIGFQLYLTN